MLIGKIIKKYRTEKKMTQKELGKKVGKAEITIRKYENENVNPPLETLIDIINVLDIPLEILKLTDDEEIDETKQQISPGVYAYGMPLEQSVPLEYMIKKLFDSKSEPWLYKGQDEVIKMCTTAMKILESQGIQVLFYEELDEFDEVDFLVYLFNKKELKFQFIYYKDFLLECEKLTWFVESEINTLFENKAKFEEKTNKEGE